MLGALCDRASLVFDAATLDANLRVFAAAGRAHDVRVLLAAKAFPDRRMFELAARHLDGFDVASPGELAAIEPERRAGAIVSIADPSGAASALAVADARVIVSCERVEQIARAPAGAEIAIRVSASITGQDPAIGAILDGSGHRRSRFGVATRDDVGALMRAAHGRRVERVGLHLHHGAVTATSAARFVATARAALALCDEPPAFLNLGGAWHGIADVSAALAQLRAELPRELELLIEPGRACSHGAGYAVGVVSNSRSLGDRELRVLDLSRAAHMRWSQPELIARAPHPGRGRNVLFVGPTCFEDDVIGEWTIDPSDLVDGDRAVLRDITGYALAWNVGFGGVPPAVVVWLDR